MDEDFSRLFDGDANDWFMALPAYQLRVIAPMLVATDPLETATTWLNAAGPRDTAGFGVLHQGANLFLDSLLVELQKLICTNEGYADERSKVMSSAKAGRDAVLVAASTAIAPHLGAAAVFLLPAVAAVFAILSNSGKTSICTLLGEVIEERTRVNTEQK